MPPALFGYPLGHDVQVVLSPVPVTYLLLPALSVDTASPHALALLAVLVNTPLAHADTLLVS